MMETLRIVVRSAERTPGEHRKVCTQIVCLLGKDRRRTPPSRLNLLTTNRL